MSSKVLLLVTLLLTPTIVLADSDKVSVEVSTSALEQLHDAANSKKLKGAEIAQKSTARQKLDPLMQSAMGKVQGVQQKLQSNALLRTKDGNQIQAYLQLESTAEVELAKLRALKVQIEVVNSKLSKVQVWLHKDKLEQVAALDNVVAVSAPKYGQPRTGSVNTQGDSIHRANLLRNMGFRGQGIRVGVVSDGSNNFADAQSSGNLPANITRFGSCSTRSADPSNCRAARTCNEGTAMAEIIHDIAPDAELAIASVSTSLEFIQRINQLANNFGANIIVDDLGFFGEPYFEDGDLANAVAALPADILYVSSAGNSGRSHYEAEFNQSDTTGIITHDFVNNDDGMGFIVPARGFVFALLQWNDPYTNPDNDYDLFVLDSTTLVGSSQQNQAGGGVDAIEAVCVPNTSSSDTVNTAIISKFSGADKRLELFLLGSPLIEHSRPQGSIFGHPGVPRALAIGAINASEPGNNDIASYSSRGPSRIDFPSIQNRAKPDFTGIDGVSVSGAGGFSNPFFGTSAAAPHVAAVAAQLMSISRNVNANQVKTALTKSAIDLGSAGRDSIYGYGLVDALAAGDFIKSPVVAPILLLLSGDDEEDAP